MAPRCTGTAVILVGMERVPVRIYPGISDPPGISFATLCATHAAKVKQQLVCTAKGETVEREETVKGYELGKGQYLTLTAEELEEIIPDPDPEIVVKEVTELEGIDPRRWTGRVQYLGPDAGKGPVTDTSALWAYAGLIEALSEASSGESTVAIARWAARGVDKLVGIYAEEGRLVLAELRRPSEVRDIAEIERAEAARPQDVERVVPVLEHLRTDAILAGAFPDERYDATLELLRAKVTEKATAAAMPKERKGPKKAAPEPDKGRKVPRRASR